MGGGSGVIAFGEDAWFLLMGAGRSGGVWVGSGGSPVEEAHCGVFQADGQSLVGVSKGQAATGGKGEGRLTGARAGAGAGASM